MKDIVFTIIELMYNAVFTIVNFLVRENEKVNIVATHHGKFFIGNSKYFFEYIFKNDPANSYLFSKQKKTISEVKSNYPKQNVLYAYSLRSMYILAKSKNLFLIAGGKDFSPYLPSSIKSKTVINLFHGIALKDMTSEKAGKMYRIILDAYIVCSEIEKESISKSFGIPPEKVWITGLPKNDILTSNTRLNPEKEKIILYAPTFRDDGSKIKLFPFDDMDFEVLTSLLEANNAKIILRLHINAIESINNHRYNTSKRIVFSDPYLEKDTQLLLKKTSVLISDYSGIFFDFLLLNRPMLFIPYDYNEYLKVRDFQFPYYESTPGPKISTFKEFSFYLEEALVNPKTREHERIECLIKFHEFREGFSERIIKRINLLQKHKNQ